MHNQMEKGANENRSLWSLRPKPVCIPLDHRAEHNTICVNWGPNVKIAHSIDCRPYVMEEDNDPDYRYESLPSAETSITPPVLVVLAVLVELVFGLRSLVSPWKRPTKLGRTCFHIAVILNSMYPSSRA